MSAREARRVLHSHVHCTHTRTVLTITTSNLAGGDGDSGCATFTTQHQSPRARRAPAPRGARSVDLQHLRCLPHWVLPILCTTAMHYTAPLLRGTTLTHVLGIACARTCTLACAPSPYHLHTCAPCINAHTPHAGPWLPRAPGRGAQPQCRGRVHAGGEWRGCSHSLRARAPSRQRASVCPSRGACSRKSVRTARTHARHPLHTPPGAPTGQQQGGADHQRSVQRMHEDGMAPAAAPAGHRVEGRCAMRASF